MFAHRDLVRISARQVVRRWARYLGVIVTIALGTAGLIVVVTMSRDVKQNINKDLDLLGGATLIKVYFGKYDPFEDRTPFRPETIDALRRLPGVAGVSGLAEKTQTAMTTRGRERYWFPLVGVDQDYWAVNSFTPVSGDLFAPAAVTGRQRVCVLGAELARRVCGSTDVAGQVIQIDKEVYRVAGVVDGPSVGDRNQWAFIPITTAQDRIHQLRPVNRLYVRCATWDDVKPVAGGLMAEIGRHQPRDGIEIEVGWERLKHVRRIVWWVELFIYTAIVATVVLGAVGIWNVMMGMVQARTREIGLKKAIGAEDADILAEFLAEAACLSLGSALLGTLIAAAAVAGLSSSLGTSLVQGIFGLCVAGSLLLALAVGLGAGAYPAVTASRMDVVTAMRYG